MINSVLQAVAGDLNAFLRNRFNHNEEVVQLSSLMSLDGSVAVTSENKIIGTLLNIEQERINLNAPRNSLTLTNPPFNLNLYVLFSAHYGANNYAEALKAISNTLGFFQGKQVFTPANTNGLPSSLDKIVVDLVNLDLKDLSNFWTAIGAKLLPSVLFRFRMVSISSDTILEEFDTIRGLSSSASVTHEPK